MTLGALIYFLLLALWSALVAYFILFKVVPLFRKNTSHEESHAEVINVHAHTPAPVSERKTFSPHEGFRSMKSGDELTVDDIVTCLANGKDC